jgi:hypothetical protein
MKRRYLIVGLALCCPAAIPAQETLPGVDFSSAQLGTSGGVQPGTIGGVLAGVAGGGGGGGGACTEECCNVHETAGCSDAGCEALVCDAEPNCCIFEWDLACQMAAADLCGLAQRSDCCGFIGPGAVCGDEACVEEVCDIDPFCCDTSWDTLCGFEAQELCGDLCCCDAGEEEGQVTICHIPPGNPDNAHTITISANALPAHLAHGDTIGPCAAAPGTGACCLEGPGVPAGGCVSHLNEAECEAEGGAFQGIGVSCGDAQCTGTGACCVGDAGCLSDTGELECLFLFGGVWQGEGTNCPDSNCTGVGACCFGGGDCTDDTGELECLFALGGVWQGDGSTCADGCNSGQGACCLEGPGVPAGGCVSHFDLSECEAEGGEFQGIGVSCGDAQCTGTGACCVGDAGCLSDTGELACLFLFGGVWQGEGSNCPDSNCTGVGACCFGGGGCTDGTGELECIFALGGVWQGDDSTCADGCNSGQGACCLEGPGVPAGGCVSHFDLSECEAEGGVFQGIGVSCGDAQCTGTGACCVGDAGCLSDTGELACLFLFGGVWQGDNSKCAQGCD